MPSHYILSQQVSYFKTLTPHLKYHFYLYLTYFYVTPSYPDLPLVKFTLLLLLSKRIKYCCTSVKKKNLLLEDDVISFVFILHYSVI